VEVRLRKRLHVSSLVVSLPPRPDKALPQIKVSPLIKAGLHKVQPVRVQWLKDQVLKEQPEDQWVKVLLRNEPPVKERPAKELQARTLVAIKTFCNTQNKQPARSSTKCNDKPDPKSLAKKTAPQPIYLK
jgi:hypothetical protein